MASHTTSTSPFHTRPDIKTYTATPRLKGHDHTCNAALGGTVKIKIKDSTGAYLVLGQSESTWSSRDAATTFESEWQVSEAEHMSVVDGKVVTTGSAFTWTKEAVAGGLFFTLCCDIVGKTVYLGRDATGAAVLVSDRSNAVRFTTESVTP